MKSTSKSASFPYTLIFCQLVLFSFAAAYGVSWLQRQSPAIETKPALDRRQLFRNYRILKQFLAAEHIPASLPRVPLLEAIANLTRAQELFAAKKFAESAAALSAVPGRFPFLADRRDDLHLRILHANRRYAELVALSAGRPKLDLDGRVLRLDGLMKTGNFRLAVEEFKPLFARHRLQAFSRLARSDLTGLLRRLNEEDWLAKFTFLLESSEAGEFRRELPYSGFRELNRLFQAEFAYLGRAYGRARQLLRVPFPEKFQAFGERLRLKMDLRDEPGLDVEGRLRRLGDRSLLSPGLLFDLAQILVGKGEFARALPLYERYLGTRGEQDERYWKTAWLLAWIHYRQDDKQGALRYFRLGSASPVPGYRIASRYWLAKLEEGPEAEMTRYPFSYYAVRGLESRQGSFKDPHQEFLLGIDDRPGARFLDIVKDLKVLVGHGMLVEAAEAIHWAKSDPLLGAGDLNLLKVIESLLYYRQKQYFMAYSKFRGNFRFPERVFLPHFLSGIFFPRAYEDLITAYSREQEVDPSLVLALIREESFFRSDVRSPANAYGLMQLLQGTARQVADGSGLKIKARDLYDPEVNIRLGLNYLKNLLDRYEGRLYLALAAYNAGPHRVDQWLQDFPLADEEEFIEMIPFSETRNYVKNILRNHFFYKYYHANGTAQLTEAKDHQSGG